MVLDEHWGVKNSQGLYSSCQISTLLFTHYSHYFECAGWKEKMILSKVKVKSNTSSGALWLQWVARELSPHFFAPYLFLTRSGRHGGGKNDAHVSLCQCPSFLVPSFCWTQPILFLLYYFWPVNMERRSNYGPFRGEYQSPFPTVLLIAWWVGPG